MFLFVYRDEPAIYYIDQKDEASALRVVKDYYMPCYVDSVMEELREHHKVSLT